MVFAIHALSMSQLTREVGLALPDLETPRRTGGQRRLDGGGDLDVLLRLFSGVDLQSPRNCCLLRRGLYTPMVGMPTEEQQSITTTFPSFVAVTSF